MIAVVVVSPFEIGSAETETLMTEGCDTVIERLAEAPAASVTV